MSTFFVDTSALAKRYLVEVGTAWVISWIEPSAGNVVVISELALVEFQSLLARQVRGGVLTAAAGDKLRSDFLIHYRDDYLVVHLDTLIAQSAGELVRKHKLRSLDAIQLASALRAQELLAEPMELVSGDENLLAAASAEDFITAAPHKHP